MSELVPPPPGGRVYEHPVRAGLADCAPGERARLDALARWLQDAAHHDLEDAGVGRAGVWVVRRTRMVIERFPRFEERLSVRTFCSGVGRMWAERRSSLPGVEAVALWVHLDARGRPTPLPADLLAAWGAAAGRRVKARLRHPPLDPDARRRAVFPLRSADLDIVGHVNNAVYWEVLEEERPDGPLDAEIEFVSPAAGGALSVLERGPMRWLVGAEGTLHASARVSSA